MRRYEFPDRMGRISIGVLLATCGGIFVFVHNGWPLAAAGFFCALSLVLRPMNYISLSNGHLLYARLVGSGRISLDKVESVDTESSGWSTVLRTAEREVRVGAHLTDYWSLLEEIVSRCANAVISPLTRELLDHKSRLHKRVALWRTSTRLLTTILLPCGAVLGIMWLSQIAFRQ